MSDDHRTMSWTRYDSIGAAGVAAVIALTGLVGIGPPVVEAMSRGELRKTLEQTRADADAMLMTAEQVQRDREATDKRLEQSKVTLVPLAELNRRVQDLVKLGSEAGVTVAQVTPGVPRKVGPSQVQRLTVTGSGKYPTVSDYMGVIHTRFLDVVMAQFSLEAARAEPASAESASGTFTFELDWYAAPEGADAAAK